MKIKLSEIVKLIPHHPGIYQMIDDKGSILYIGKAKNLKKRVSQYLNISKLPVRLQRMVYNIDRVEIIETHTEAEALLLETNLIKTHKPPCNIIFKDDKSLPYVVISTSHQSPRIYKYRGKKNKKDTYFGPFASSASVNSTIHMIEKIFKIRSCQDSYFNHRTRPCLLYHIHRCSAPCVNRIESDEYLNQVEQAKLFLKGKSDKVRKLITQKMEESSKELNYELAAKYRDQLKAITLFQSEQNINIQSIKDVDLISFATKGLYIAMQIYFYRNGKNYGNKTFIQKTSSNDDEKHDLYTSLITQFYHNKPIPKEILLTEDIKYIPLLKEALELQSKFPISIDVPQRGVKKKIVLNALENTKNRLDRALLEKETLAQQLKELSILLNLDNIPHRIEVYDNSHISGSNAYGAMIVCNQDGFDKSAYRKFKIKNPNNLFAKQDDYAMMREVFSRRFKDVNCEKNPIPDLVIVDGGIGQLNAAKEILNNLELNKLPIISIAKGPNRNAGEEKIYQVNHSPIKLPKNSSTLLYLQVIRDESHRFAIGTHIQARQKNIKKSSLDKIPGVGPKRKKALIQFFGSVKNVENAGIDDLKKVEGINDCIAKSIYNNWH